MSLYMIGSKCYHIKVVGYITTTIVIYAPYLNPQRMLGVIFIMV